LPPNIHILPTEPCFVLFFINIDIYDLYFAEFNVFVQQENTFPAVQQRRGNKVEELEFAPQHLVFYFAFFF